MTEKELKEVLWDVPGADEAARAAAHAHWARLAKPLGGLGALEALRPETVHGDSRFDFSFIREGRTCFLEVKGVTLEQDGVCLFPDAPTIRGTKHLYGLTQAAGEGYGAYVLFVIQMSDVKCLRPNEQTDPAFAAALRHAAKQGVHLLAAACAVTPDSMTITAPVPICL